MQPRKQPRRNGERRRQGTLLSCEVVKFITTRRTEFRWRGTVAAVSTERVSGFSGRLQTREENSSTVRSAVKPPTKRSRRTTGHKERQFCSFHGRRKTGRCMVRQREKTQQRRMTSRVSPGPIARDCARTSTVTHYNSICMRAYYVFARPIVNVRRRFFIAFSRIRRSIYTRN